VVDVCGEVYGARCRQRAGSSAAPCRGAPCLVHDHRVAAPHLETALEGLGDGLGEGEEVRVQHLALRPEPPQRVQRLDLLPSGLVPQGGQRGGHGVGAEVRQPLRRPRRPSHPNPSKTIKEFYLVTEQVKDLLAFSPFQASHQHCHNLILSCQCLFFFGVFIPWADG